MQVLWLLKGIRPYISRSLDDHLLKVRGPHENMGLCSLILICFYSTPPMRREVVQDFKLSNGTVIRKGQMIMTDLTHMWNSSYCKDPDKFDGYRFLRMWQTPGKKNQGRFVSTSAEHLEFGHGQFVHPWRFFVANEIKILFCHMLLKYDWKLAPGLEPQIKCNGFFMVGDRSTKLLVKRRKEELHLASLAV